MITKVSTVSAKSSFWRLSLKKSSSLKSLAGSSMQGGFHIPRTSDMIVPGGMTKAETFVYKLTGKVPQSVKDRWYEAGTGDRALEAGDQKLSFCDGEVTDNHYYTDADIDTYFSGDSGDDSSATDLLDGLL